MSCGRFLLASLLAALLAAAPSARAQTSVTAPPGESAEAYTATQEPAHVVLVDGTATLERDARMMPAAANTPVLAGDRLQTDDGRLELAFTDGTILDLDRDTGIVIMSDTLVQLLEGRLILRVPADRSVEGVYEVDAPAGRVETNGPGVYRITLDTSTAEPQLEAAVVRGWATLTSGAGSVVLGAGEASYAEAGQLPVAPEHFNVARLDDFDRWSDAQREARVAESSGADLPSSLDVYAGELDRSGQWASQPPYGEVWYPDVSAGWRPYENGSWDYIAPFGWTWIGAEPWAWPTMHFGRWGLSSAGWFWIPGRHWGPAWVSWVASPSFVSWCPLGFDNRPIVSPWLGFNRISPSHVWTVVPRARFSQGRPVKAIALHGHEITKIAGSHFVASEPAPPRTFAVARRASPEIVVPRGRGSSRDVAVPRRAPDAPAYAPRYTPRYAPRSAPDSAAGRTWREVMPQRGSSSTPQLRRPADRGVWGPGTLAPTTRQAMPRGGTMQQTMPPRVVVPRTTTPRATVTPRSTPVAPAATATPRSAPNAPAATAPRSGPQTPAAAPSRGRGSVPSRGTAQPRGSSSSGRGTGSH